MKKVVAIASFLIVGLSAVQAYAFDPAELQGIRADLGASAATGVAKRATAFSAAAQRGLPVASYTTGATTSGAITKTLSFGLKKDAQVLKLQTFLVANGYLTATPDGNFGAKTLAAVKKFQIANGLPALGIVGPQTRALIK
jgi:hypothetical protein